MIPRIIMYITVSLGISAAAWWSATNDSAARHASHRVLARIVPTTIEERPVYPSNHAIISLDPTQEYRWQTIDLPESWPLGQYYIELWGKNNRPIPGFYAQKLTAHTLDISTIDASLNPALRVVVFQPDDVPSLPAHYAVYMYYTEQPNSRLFLLLAVAAFIYWTMFIWLDLYWRVLWMYPSAVKAQLRGKWTSPVWASLSTLVFAGIFGVVLGSFIGGIQIIYVLVKLPLLMVTALLISFSTLVMFSWFIGLKSTLRTLWMVALNLLTITALGLVALSPILEFYILYPLNHDQVLTAAVAFFVAAGLLAVVSLYRWLASNQVPFLKRAVLPIIWISVYGLVFMQLGWLLRPWVGVLDPVHDTVPFARPYSGNVFIEIGHTLERLDST